MKLWEMLSLRSQTMKHAASFYAESLEASAILTLSKMSPLSRQADNGNASQRAGALDVTAAPLLVETILWLWRSLCHLGTQLGWNMRMRDSWCESFQHLAPTGDHGMVLQIRNNSSQMDAAAARVQAFRLDFLRSKGPSTLPRLWT
jgi:hypothetical protein